MYSNEKLYDVMVSGNYVKCIEMLEENIREETAKRNGGTHKQDAVIKRLLKKDNIYYHGYTKVNAFDDEYYGFTDGYRIMATKTDYGFPECDRKINLDTCLDIDNYFGSAAETFSFDLNYSDILRYAKTEYKKRQEPYVIKIDYKGEEEYLAFNPKYMVDAIEFCGGNSTVILNRNMFKTARDGGIERYIGLIYIVTEDKNSFAATLPINLGGDFTVNDTASDDE